MQDERLSSHEAEERLATQDRDWRKRKAKLDAASAAVILQDYLDRQKPDPDMREEG
jgi:RNase H-fold protein (predicted Holliday junction resolvase)